MHTCTRGSVLAVSILILAAGCGDKSAPPPPPPIDVKVATVLQRDVPIETEAIGETRGSTEIDIQTRVEGFLETVNFQEGMPVGRGQLLFTIDPRTFEANLAQARAMLAEAEARLARARQDVDRFKPLVEQHAIARQDYDNALSNAAAAEASVASAQAVAARAEIDLGYTRITSPIDGIAGKVEVQPGNLVGRGQTTLLTRISDVDPIHVRFSVSEREYLRIRRGTPDPQSPARPGGRPITLILADGSTHPHPGQLVFADRLVDPTTGTLLLEAAFPNPERIVRPGQFARVRAAVDVAAGALLVPQRAVSELQAMSTVAVVNADRTVSLRTVTPGARIGSLWIIENGLAAGDQVVVEGRQKVREGSVVNPIPVAIEE
ncbi:MAG TPA: efflux RND transporter periplasmic adaptor subunit [Candidatus Krumholzibacteria bacterium]|nr:efflux RND transporter periplasmic adaptor subunit [Candidatus Krumholzibacteria bacterium]HPD71860.1 efflux RND transporter periplasmic adaptor subunit [Candidatus Krumholzibacteria bacterium]HRY41207.1 efflux RND transporter periplasmic adaptor subunit [Candidatus Krumholzibacteria bacterium]